MKSRTVYHSFQFAWFILFPVVIIFFVLYLYLSQTGSKPISLWPFVLIELLFCVMILLLYGMETELTEDDIAIKFGIGIISKKVKLDQIESVLIVRNHLFEGIGINLISKGIIYSAHGLDAVELNLITGRRIRIGSQEAEKLKFEIEKQLTLLKSENRL